MKGGISLENTLYYGDNLDILRKHVHDDSVDLIYLDPPFNSKANYNILYKEISGEFSDAQITAFEDTWHWTENTEATFKEIIDTAPANAVKMMTAFRSFIGENDMMAYLTMMCIRLIELRRVLKDTGSIYLHCDPTASHYLKILMDTIFDKVNFRNEIIWKRTGSHNSAKRYGPIHDVLLFYSKSEDYYFKTTYRPYLKGHIAGYFKQQDHKGKYWTNALTGAGIRHGDSGKPWRNYDPTAIGRHWAIPGKISQELGLSNNLTTQEKLDALDVAGFIDHPIEGSISMPTYRQYLDKSPGMSLQDIWAYHSHTSNTLYNTNECIDEDVRWLVAQGDTERLGYPTQKPVGLLERIIKSSCPEDGWVLDPFCGCGTAVTTAQKLNRSWIGIDITHLAINLIKLRLKGMFGIEPKNDYRVVGEPEDLKSAIELASQNRYQFQWWATSLIEAKPYGDKKKGKDTGIDGFIFFMDKGHETKKCIVSVKSGNVHPTDIRDLGYVLSRENAEIGVFITLHEPTSGMIKDAISAGYYRSQLSGKDYPKIQILTIEELLKGIKPKIPNQISPFKKATPSEGTQLDLVDTEE
jgi:adenine specific DNA methylase Mod